MYSAQLRKDSGEALFLARQLEYIIPQVYRKKYPIHKARIHFPPNFTGGKGLVTITHRMLDRRGRAAVGLGFPRVTLAQKEYYTQVKPLTAGYSYNIMDIHRAMQANMPLEVESAYAAKMVISELEDRLAYVGDEEANLNGAFNSREVAIQVAEYPISPASTPDQIIQVINKAINTAPILSLGVEQVNYVIMGVPQYTHISTTPRSNLTDTTILEYLQKAHPDVIFDWCNHCTGTGIGGSDVMFCYSRSEDSVQLMIPSDFEQLPVVQTENAEFVTNCIEYFGGVKFIYASAVLVVGV